MEESISSAKDLILDVLSIFRSVSRDLDAH